MERLEKGFGNATKEGLVYGDLNVMVDIAGGGTVAFQSKVQNDWVTFKLVDTNNEFPHFDIANAVPFRIFVTGSARYHVY